MSNENPVTVKNLIDFLSQFPSDMVVLEVKYSDFQFLSLSSFEIKKGVDCDFYVMRSHPTMSDERKAREKTYLVFQGN